MSAYYDFSGYANEQLPPPPAVIQLPPQEWVLKNGLLYWCGEGWSMDIEKAVKFPSCADAKMIMRHNNFTALVFPAN